MLLICDYCGEMYDSEDENVCPNCGTLSSHRIEDENEGI